MTTQVELALQVDRDEGLVADYWNQSRYPLTCLVFLAPLLLGFEIAIRIHDSSLSEGGMNGAYVWLQEMLGWCGVKFAFSLPLLVAVCLLIRHLFGRFPIRVTSESLTMMCVESLLLALLLVLLGQVQVGMVTGTISLIEAAIPSENTVVVLTSVGAGLYEEFLFRAMLLPAMYLAFRFFLLPRIPAMTSAVILTSLLFSAAHYVGVSGDPFSIMTFCFRTWAGIFFCVVYLTRGLGIAVGCHVMYNILVHLMAA